MPSTQSVQVAVLDDYASVSPKHFRRIQNLDNVDYFADTLNAAKPEGLQALIQRLQPYTIICTMRERTAFPAALLKQLPNLKLLLTTGIRNASIDLPAATAQGITVAGTKGEWPANPSPDYEPPPPPGQSTVTQHAWALLLSLCGRIAQDDRLLRTDPTYWQGGLIISLPGKTLGLLGLGKLGALMAKVGVQAFGMKVIAWSESLTQEKADAAATDAGLVQGAFKAVGKEEFFKQADVVSVHLVLSERSRGVVGKQELQWMKGSSVLLNTSRGGLIDEGALVETLKSGGIGGFATDVFWEEPIAPDSVWRKTDEWAKSATVLSPHMGYVSAGTMNRWYEEQVENIERYLRGDELLVKMN